MRAPDDVPAGGHAYPKMDQVLARKFRNKLGRAKIALGKVGRPVTDYDGDIVGYRFDIDEKDIFTLLDIVDGAFGENHGLNVTALKETEMQSQNAYHYRKTQASPPPPAP